MARDGVFHIWGTTGHKKKSKPKTRKERVTEGDRLRAVQQQLKADFYAGRNRSKA